MKFTNAECFTADCNDPVYVDFNYSKGCAATMETPAEDPEIEILAIKQNGVDATNFIHDMDGLIQECFYHVGRHADREDSFREDHFDAIRKGEI